MGNFISLGFKIHELLNIPNNLVGSILTSFCGYTMLFVGVGIFIAVNIGMDPVTGVIMLVRDKIKREYKSSKIICDVISLVIGFTLGGKVGAATFIAAFIAGPIIQKVSEIFDNTVLKKLNLSKLAVD
jgi:uncharacterized membrane protein YczE